MPDVVVVGGGIIGAACADELTRRGASVTLIERDELAAGASGRNQGLWVPPEDPALQLMAARSLLRYLAVTKEAPLPVWIDPRPVGTVYVAIDDDALPATEAMIRRVGTTEPHIDELDAGALAELERSIDDLLGEALRAVEAAPVTEPARAALVELAHYVAWRSA